MAQARYYDYSEDEMAERQPLGGPGPTPPRHRQQYHQQEPYYSQQDAYNSPPSQYRQGGRPDPSFERLRSQRRYNQEAANSSNGNSSYAAAGAIPNAYGASGSPPRTSPHHETDRRPWGQGPSYPPPAQRPSPQSTITPGADNFSNAAAGGMAGIALTVAEHNARESGLNALHNPQYPYQQHGQDQGYPERGTLAPGGSRPADRNSHSSLQGLNAGALGTGYATPGQRTPSRSAGDVYYSDDPYQNLSRHQDSNLGVVNPHDIADDGDDGLEYGRRGPRTSMLSIGSSHKSGTAAAGGAVTGGGLFGGLASRNGSGNVSTQYTPVKNGASADGGFGGSGGKGIYNAGVVPGDVPSGKLHALSGATARKKSKKWKLILLIAIALAVIAGLVLGILFGVVFKQDDKKSAPASGDGGQSAADDLEQNGDLNINSAEIKALMNNPDLRKVFVGMDYTPINTQYPECIHNPPSQNNVTRDLAVLSQLTNVVRLYGTDCNQTQMLIHAVDQLRLKDKVKIWLGVWQDKNETTNARQLEQMWDILDQYGESYFKGIIVANEILFREEMTITTLGSLLEEVRTNLTAKGMSLPVATSDLGDKWDATLASQSDAIMANIHPFFAGEPAKTAAAWTMSFWNNKMSGFVKSDKSMNIISETGWPSQGGMGCGNAYEIDCPDRAVAGIEEMNIFMEDWVCGALKNGTEYLWFEAFDEPWKWYFNTEGRQWEDHWGLMTVNRELKEGLKIPDCGGMRVPE